MAETKFLDRAGLVHLWGAIKTRFEAVNDRIDEVELFKFPNVTIFGEPTINHGQMSNFSTVNYAQFPFVVDFRNRPFEINMAFTTGNDVTNQQNIIDSVFGLAFAVSNGKFLIAISTNGTNWDLGAQYGTYSVQPNTPYYVKISWDGSSYKVAYSTDKQTYTDDIVIASAADPYPRQIVIGVGDRDKAIPKVFGGIINLNDSNLIISGKVVWQGMDDAGLATRLAVDMSNLDDAGTGVINGLIDTKLGDVEAALDAILGGVGT